MHHREQALIIPTDDLGVEVDDDTATGGANWGGRLLWLGIGTIIGALVSYLADPDRGNARRAELAQRAGARGRDAQEQAVDQARDAAQRSVGAAIDAVPEMTQPDDAVLLERVRAQAIGPADVDKNKIVTTARDGGVIEIRGEVDTVSRRRELLEAVTDVEGVRQVVDLTHLPNEPAPTRTN